METTARCISDTQDYCSEPSDMENENEEEKTVISLQRPNTIVVINIDLDTMSMLDSKSRTTLVRGSTKNRLMNIDPDNVRNKLTSQGPEHAFSNPKI